MTRCFPNKIRINSFWGESKVICGFSNAWEVGNTPHNTQVGNTQVVQRSVILQKVQLIPELRGLASMPTRLLLLASDTVSDS